MTTIPREDFGGAAWRLKRARSLIQRAQTACGEGDLDRACTLIVAALSQLPLQLFKNHMRRAMQ
jgi:hypothetical protein